MKKSVSEWQLSQLSAFVAARMGLHFPRERWPDLERGIRSAARELDFDDVGACIQCLLTSPTGNRIEILAGHLTVGETYFFRDGKTFEALEQRVLPELIPACREAGKHLRIWSAGAATGEEPYSIAILLVKMIPDWQKWNISILATDINPRFLRKAAGGVYGRWSFRNTPQEIKDRYFKKTGADCFEIAPRIKELVSFSYLNLADESYPSLATNTHAMNLIFCRNVLMYFTAERARKVVHGLHRSLVAGGWLIVSPGEASHVLLSEFAMASFPGVIFYRKEGRRGEERRGEGETRGLGDDRVIPPLRTPPVEGTAISPHLPLSPSPRLRISPSSPPFASLSSLKSTTRPPHERGFRAEAPERVAELISEHDPHDTEPESLALQARLYADLGKLDAALEWCEKAIAVESLNAGFHFLMATVLQELDQPDAALTSLRHALYLDPKCVPAHVAMGNISLRCGRRKESKKHFENALSLLSALRPEDVLPEYEGMTAGRLMEIIRSTAPNVTPAKAGIRKTA